MKTVTARMLPQTGLGYVFAVTKENGKIDHYSVNGVRALVENQDNDVEGAISFFKQYLEHSLKESVNLVVLDKPTIVTTHHGENSGGSMFEVQKPKTVDLDREFFSWHTLKELEARKSDGLIYLFMKKNTFLPNWLAITIQTLSRKFTDFVVNSIFYPINQWIRSNSGLNVLNDKLFQHYESEHTTGSSFEALKWQDELVKLDSEYQKVLNSTFLFPESLKSINFYYRDGYPVVTLSLTVGEEDLEEAIQTLSDELDEMSFHNLIFGHFKMPGMVKQNNTIGNGKNIYTVYAMPIMNVEAFKKALDEKDGFVGFGRLNELDITTYANEGYTTYLNGKVPYQDLVDQIIDTSDFDGRRQKENDEIAAAYVEQQKGIAALQARKRAEREAQQEKK